MSPPVCKKVIVLGLDGATFDLIKPWVSQGKLPTLARLMGAGAWGELASTIPPHSPPAWSTFATGLNPGKHGVVDFRRRRLGTYETALTHGIHRHGYPIWRILSDYERTVGVVNLPITYPPEPVNGILISGMDTPDSATDYAYPPDLAPELIRETGDHIHFVGAFLLDDMNAGRYGSAWDRIDKILEWRIKTVRYLLHSREFDFFVVNFSATDAVQHHFWRFMDPAHPQYEGEAAAEYGDCVYEVYKKLDAYVDEVWSGLDEDSVLIVMSDHGFGPASTRAVYLNNWLEQQDLLKPKNRMARSWWRRYIPEFAKRLGRQLMPNLYDKARAPLSPIFVDWGKTRAYADEYLQCVWINTVGRDPQGLVQPGDDYEELRNFIVEGLESLHDPDTGLPVIGKVYRREDIYWGTHLDVFPDLQVEQRWEPFFQIRPSYTAPDLAPVRTLASEKVLADRLLSGVHRPNGIFFAAGDAIRPAEDLRGLKLIDLPSTVLYLLGVPVPACFDGRVLEEILNKPVPVEYTSEYDYESFIPRGRDNLYKGRGDEESIMERLRGLGYVD